MSGRSTRLRKAWQSRPGAALTFAMAVAALALLLMFASNSFRVAKFIEWPQGCDEFGYLRQARLFQQKGWIGGLDTRIDDERSLYLVDKLKGLGAPPPLWSDGVAPHCHNYQARTQRIVLQYPPGVGFVFSFFTESVQAHWAFVLYNFFLLLVLLPIALTARTATGPLLALALGALLFRGIYLFIVDLSIAPSVVLALLAGWLTATAAAAPPARRIGLLALLGLALGLATSFRIANVLLLAGPAAVLGALFLRRPSRPSFAAAASLALGALAGMLPLLAANAINAGHPLATTYGLRDATPVHLAWDVLGRGLHHYFVRHATQAAVIAIAAAALAVVLYAQRRRRFAGIGQAAAMAAVSLAVTIAFMVLHEPHVYYYLFPALAYAVATAVLSLVAMENARAGTAAGATPRRGMACAGAVLLAAVALTRFIPMTVSPDFTRQDVTARFEPRAVVWADLMSGPIVYFLHRQASVLSLMHRDLRRPVIEAIARDGVPQFMLADSPSMREQIERMRSWVALRPAGQAFGQNVFRLDFTPDATARTADGEP